MYRFKTSLKSLLAVAALLFATSALAQPNLAPYQPSGWSDKIVVSTVSNTSTDGSPLLTTSTLYVDWAVANFGNVAAGSFVVSLYVDGVFRFSWNPSSLGASTYTYVQDQSIGSLSAGTHTVTITADSGGTVAESNEADNSYTKTITIGGSSLPNLTPYQPAGWSDKIVVSTGTGTSTDSSPLIYTNTLYVDWAVINNGNSTASNFTTSLYVDGVFQTSWSTPALGSNTYTSALDYSIGSLSAGTHTVAITTDSGSVVAESSEADNTYTKTITVSTPSLPNLTPYQPVGWADKIVISTVAGTSTDNTPLFATNTIYVDWAVNNNGSVAAGSFATTLYLDGVLQQTWNTGSLSVNGYIYIQDYSLGTLNAGSHTIQITADSGGTVGESNEADNTYSRTISIGAVTAPAPTLTAPANGATSQPTTPAFSWTAVSNVTGYRILVATSAADLPTNPTNSTGGPSLVLNATSSTNAYTPVVPLNPGTTYYWEVHGINGGDIGDWSAIRSFTTAVPPSGLTIVPTFDSTITSDPQAAAIQATINAAIAVYQSSFSDTVTVHITFHKMASGLGLSSGVYYQPFSYSSYRAALVSHATTADDTTALVHLSNGAGNPVNGNSSINLKLALARALGFSADPPAGQPDGTISLNIGIMNVSQASTDPAKYSLFSTASHEMDEILGLGSALDSVKNGVETLADAVSPEDLFRYDVSGARNYTTNVSATAYFSLDGITNLAQFNQAASGDFGDWYSLGGGQTPQVQDAFAPPNVSPVLGVELRVLDAIGYTRVQGSKTNQAITFGALTNRTYGDPPFAVSATASSGLPVSFSILSGPATISGTNVTITNTGTVTIRASQAGNANYNAAPNVDQSFTVFSPPSIGVALSAQSLVLSWPTNIAGFSLLTTTNLAGVITWTNAAPAPVILNGRYVVTNTTSGPKRFYRLKK